MPSSDRCRVACRLIPGPFKWRWLVPLVAAFVAGTSELAAAAEVRGNTSRVAVASPAQEESEENRSKPFSPLHDFLGIDTETGQFKPQTQRPASPPDRSSEAARRDAEAAEGDQAIGGHLPQAESQSDAMPSRPPPPTLDDLPRTAEEANEAFRRVAERVSEGSFDDLASVWGESMQGSPLLRMHRQIVWALVALMLMYPLGMMLAELLSYLTTRNRAGLTAMDRQFQRAQLWRRVTVAISLAAVIVLFGYGNLHGYWWNQPTRMAIFAVTVLIFGSLAVVVGNLIRQAARTYELDLLRDIRREQLEIRADLDELRKQSKQATTS